MGEGDKVKLKIRQVTFECDPAEGTAKVTTPTEQAGFDNAIEGWNFFTSRALLPFEVELRNALQENGFNRWTGVREHGE